MEEKSDSSSLRLVLFPWLAFGHMHPILELSKLLASRGHCITFISTPRNIQRLPRIPSHLSSLITFVPLPLPHVEPLPENAESTSDIPQEHVQYLEKAFDGLATPFLAFLESACSDESTKPDWIITDTHLHWVPRIAKVFNVPYAMFAPFPVSSQVFFGPPSEFIRPSRTAIEHLTVPPSWIPFPSKLAFRPHEARWIMTITEERASGISLAQRGQSTIMESEFICLRACYELESKWISLLAELYQKDIVPVGSLLPPVEDASSRGESKGSKLEFHVINWLNRCSPKSVLYIALGSEANLSIELLRELAFGLMKAEIPFLWALRKPTSMSGSTADLLPEGFQEQIKGYGYVAAGWVPQVMLLAHASIGAFLTHCGPGSVIESLQFGHPLVMLPLLFEQGLNARVLEERGVGVEVPRDAETGNFDRDGVARTIRRVMVEDEGRMIRRNAEQVQSIYTDKVSQDKHLDGLIKRLQKYAK